MEILFEEEVICEVVEHHGVATVDGVSLAELLYPGPVEEMLSTWRTPNSGHLILSGAWSFS